MCILVKENMVNLLVGIGAQLFFSNGSTLGLVHTVVFLSFRCFS